MFLKNNVSIRKIIQIILLKKKSPTLEQSMKSKHSLNLNFLLAPEPMSSVCIDPSLCDPWAVASEKFSGRL